MSADEWIGVAITIGLLLAALGLTYTGRTILHLADVIGHDHDTRWHYDDPPDQDTP